VQENEKEYIDKKAFIQETSNWEVEEEQFTKDRFGHLIKVSRLIHKQDIGKGKPRRLIAVGKKNKSIGIDMETVFGLTALMRLLSEKYVSQDLK
jgi:hypothetical protein